MFRARGPKTPKWTVVGCPLEIKMFKLIFTCKWKWLCNGSKSLLIFHKTNCLVLTTQRWSVGCGRGSLYLQYRQIACFKVMSHNVSAAISYKNPGYKRQQGHQLPIDCLLLLTLDAIENFISFIRRACLFMTAYLNEIFLSSILSITVFPVAMCLDKVGLLLPLPVLLDAETLLELKDNQELLLRNAG